MRRQNRQKKKSDGKSFMVTLPSETFFLMVNNHIASRYRLNLKESLQALCIGYMMDPVERAAIGFVLSRRARIARGEHLPIDRESDLEILKLQRAALEDLYELIGQEIIDLSRRVNTAEYSDFQVVLV